MPAGHDISSASGDLLPVLYVTDDDESIFSNAQLIIEDVYELSAPYGLELATDALLSIQTEGLALGSDASGKFLEI